MSTRCTLLCLAGLVGALRAPRVARGRRGLTLRAASLAPPPPERVIVETDANAVGAKVLQLVDAAAAAAIAQRGAFSLAIPGGSVLKMLAGSTPAWADKCTVAYVNHKCVAMDDATLATHAKAKALFLDGWAGCVVLDLAGTADGCDEAARYTQLLEAVPASTLPRSAVDGTPVFDMMLVGVGDDGHVGSLYPGRDEVLDASGKWVLAVAMKSPPSISLSLKVMAAAENVVIAACGVSDKYPQGKSDAMKRAVEGDETLSTFPAAGLRAKATYVFDQAAASKLSAEYRS